MKEIKRKNQQGFFPSEFPFPQCDSQMKNEKSAKFNFSRMGKLQRQNLFMVKFESATQNICPTLALRFVRAHPQINCGLITGSPLKRTGKQRHDSQPISMGLNALARNSFAGGY